MNMTADWIIPSHYRELNLSKGQRAAAHRISALRKDERAKVAVVKRGAGKSRLAKQDFRVRPARHPRAIVRNVADDS